MRPDYKNWMPKGMVLGFLAGAIAAAVLAIVFGCTPLLPAGVLKTVLTIVFTAAAVVLCGLTIWGFLMYRAFDYNGTRQMSRQIIEGVASYVDLPAGAKSLDVGCGSGALAIAVAKRNPKAEIIGIDRWGKEYASFSKKLCEQNSKAEGVANTSFRQGDATHLEFPDESFDAVTSNYVYHNIVGHDKQKLLLETLRVLKKGGTFAIHDLMEPARYGDMEAFVRELKAQGCEDVRLIRTTDGSFMGKAEGTLLGLGGSTLLVGRKGK